MCVHSCTNTGTPLFREELDELKLQVDARTKLGDDLHVAYDDVTSRMRQLEKSHKEHMAQRQSTLSQHQQDLTDNLQLNKELASKYRQLQNDYMLLKNQVLNKYTDRVKVEDAIKDLKQVGILCMGLRFEQHKVWLQCCSTDITAGHCRCKVSSCGYMQHCKSTTSCEDCTTRASWPIFRWSRITVLPGWATYRKKWTPPWTALWAFFMYSQNGKIIRMTGDAEHRMGETAATARKEKVHGVKPPSQFQYSSNFGCSVVLCG